YDVTLVLPEDQVVTGSGLVVAGDAGWARVSRTGTPVSPTPYAGVPPAPSLNAPPGYRSVRFYARDIHHFAWTTSPNYRYEGGWFVSDATPPEPARVAHDSVAIHIL